MRPVVLVVDVANVVGSVPDGWWHDRAAATTRLLEAVGELHGRTVTGPDGDIRLDRIVAVVEGAARAATAPARVELVLANHDGDRMVVEQARMATLHAPTVVVTADRGLRTRLPDGVLVAGPGWLNDLLGR